MSYILIAEDERDMVLLMQRKLEMAGYTVWATGDGNAALEKMQSDPPALAILDVMLPGRDGLSICADVKAMYGQGAPRVIIVSARGRTDDLRYGEMAGADAYIVKPFAPRELIEQVQALIGS